MRASSVDLRDWVVSRLCYTQAVLRLELLGNVRVLLRGVPVSLGVKPLALLVHLALEGRASRRALATLIWQDAPRPLNNLSVAKHQLERALGDVLDADTETLALKDFSCDALEFTADNPAAWGLWRGGFFTGVRLAGWEMQLSESWQDWLYQTRSHFAALRQQIAVSLAEQRIAAGDLKGALTFLEVAASGDEPSEDAATRLMLVLGALDRPQAALEVFNRLVRLLRDELGVEAMPETKAALDLARSSAAACRTTLKPRADVVQSEASDLPFVGRDAELRCVSEWLQSGSPRVAVIEGEPGAGKTRFAVELTTRHAGDHVAARVPARIAERRDAGGVGAEFYWAIHGLAQRLEGCTGALDRPARRPRIAAARFGAACAVHGIAQLAGSSLLACGAAVR